MRTLPPLLAILLLTPPLAWSQDTPHVAIDNAKLFRIAAPTTEAMHAVFRYTGETLPFVSAHRGGPEAGFPENCIPTFEHTLQHTFAILEIDPRQAKDAIVVHHDPTLDRTTTGHGKLADHTLTELKQLRLKDPQGAVTPFQMPTLDEVLEWARGRTILVLDQKDVSVADRVARIEAHQAETYAMLIVYSFENARECYAKNPRIMMEVMIPNLAKVAEFDRLGIPWSNVVAFVGHQPPEDAALYEAIHKRGACCMIGTSRNLDKQFVSEGAKDIQSLEPGYRAFLQRGADLIETDIPVQLGPMLYAKTAIPAAKAQSFVKPR